MTDPSDDLNDAEPSEGEIAPRDAEERDDADALARSLDSKGDPAPGSAAATALALRAGRGPIAALDPARKAAMIARAVARARAERRRRQVRSTAFAFAAAAAVLLAIGGVGLGLGTARGSSGRVAVVYGGASDSVFGDPFPEDQRASERLDVLTSARTRDYFAALGAGGGAR